MVLGFIIKYIKYIGLVRYKLHLHYSLVDQKNWRLNNFLKGEYIQPFSMKVIAELREESIMAFDILEKEIAIREHRLGSITGFKGTVKDLISESAGGCALKNSGRCFSQASSCMSGSVQGYLAEIYDAVIVNHAPVGCAADAIGGNTLTKWSEKARGWNNWTPRNIGFFSTNMSMEDTVFGATEKLKETIREAYRRYKPNAIFITTSCVTAIIGEDIQSALDELKEEIPIPLAPVYCEGFKTRVWATGRDMGFHAILTNIVKPPRFKTNKVNLFNFHASARVEITEMFARLGLEPVFLVAQTTVEEISRISEAAASVSVCGTLSTYVEDGLEKLYGVPSVKALHPTGIAGVESWLRGLAKVVGKDKEVEELIQEQRELYGPAIEKLKEKLQGRTVVLGMGPGFAHDYVRTFKELGMEVIWATAWHYDQNFDDGSLPDSTVKLIEDGVDVPISICDLQSFEMLSLVNKLRPDIYVARHGGTSGWTAKLGIASIMVTDEYYSFGYKGTVKFGNIILDKLTNRSRERNLGKWLKLPYTEWWLKQNSFEFLEQGGK